MKQRLQGMVIGALIVVVIGCASAWAKDAAETITAVYRNIKLVVDGVLVEPKDVNGNVVEPFIYNGTTYLPVRAVGQAFNKQIEWDGENNTVYLGGEVDKPAKELTLWNRSYIECSETNKVGFKESQAETYIEWDSGYGGDEVASRRYRKIATIKYPLNALAKSVKGEFYVKGSHSTEGVLKILNSNGKVIYESPIMRESTTPVKFDVNVENEIALTFQIERTIGSNNTNDWSHSSCYIKNPIIVSSDY